MGYILNLRKKIGHQTLLMPCSTIILENEKGEILLQLRQDDQTWGLHGGSIEIDEEVEVAAKRELKEETGLIANQLHFLKYYSGSKFHHIYPNGDEVSIIDFVFFCSNYHGELKVQENEVKELRFFNKKNLPNNIFESNKIILADYLSSINNLNK